LTLVFSTDRMSFCFYLGSCLTSNSESDPLLRSISPQYSSRFRMHFPNSNEPVHSSNRGRRKESYAKTTGDRTQNLDAEQVREKETAIHQKKLEKENTSGEGTVKETNVATFSVDEDGNKVINEYVIIKSIGRGSSSKVKLCINTQDNELYAMKIVYRPNFLHSRTGRLSSNTLSHSQQHIPLEKTHSYKLREISILKRLHHPNIVALKQVIDDPSLHSIYMIFEYMELGPVMVMNSNSNKNQQKNEVENVNEAEINEDELAKERALEINIARKYFCDILNGLEYVHGKGIIHGDIKPENLLVSTIGVAKLSDFGSAHVLIQAEGGHEDDDIQQESAQNQFYSNIGGTPAFICPELCSGYGLGEVRADFSRDIWALGATLYCLVVGRIPFVADNVLAMYEQIRNDPVEFPFSVDAGCEDVIRGMLHKDPAKRLTLKQIRQHPWVLEDQGKTFSELIET